MIITLLIIFVIIGIINAFFLFTFNQTLIEKLSEAVELGKPANLQTTRILVSDCTNCFDITTAVDDLKSQNTNITDSKSLEYTSAEARDLIRKYSITKLPTLIIRGETSKTSQLTAYWDKVGESRGENYSAVIYTNFGPPYYDVTQDKVVGLVKLTQITDSDCTKCSNFELFIQTLKQAGVVFTEEKNLDYGSEEGKALIQKLGIQQIPAVILSDDILAYQGMEQTLQQVNATLKEDSFALHTDVPPYRDLSAGKIVGLVTMTYLTDSSCTECYDVSVNKAVLARFGVVLDKEITFDSASAEGKNSITKYNITKVPTFILSEDADAYLALKQVWSQVGTIENGVYVFRSPEVFGTYKDLSAGTVVKPPAQQQG